MLDIEPSYVRLSLKDIAAYVSQHGMWDLTCRLCTNKLGIGDNADNRFPESNKWNRCARCLEEERLLKQQELDDQIEAVSIDKERIAQLRRDRIQCKHISTVAILKFLADNEGKWCTWFGGFPNSVQNALLPDVFPDRLVLAKMSMLCRKGLVSGCWCGCRGDFEITVKGWDRLNYGND